MSYKEKTILILDDQADILNLIVECLYIAGFKRLLTASTQVEALTCFAKHQIDLAILDIMLPDGSGFEVLRHIRKTSQIPVLFLSAVSDIEKQYQGFELGADDYIIKPFRPKDLELRLISILRRAYPETARRLQLTACQVDFEQAQVWRDDEGLALTAKEFALLKLLADHANKILTFDQILSSVWGLNYQGYENTLMAHIRKIRQKIEVNPSKPDHLLTVKGLGYQLRVKS